MQSNNLYTYCRNNPLKYKDPSGDEGVAALMLWDAFFGGGKTQDYTNNIMVVNTFDSSPILNATVNGKLGEFKNMSVSSHIFSDSISFYGNDLNPKDLDLHLGVGKANYTMEFRKESVKKRFLWKTWTEIEYSVKITISDTYNFDEHREGTSISNYLNNFGYDLQKNGDITPYSWSVTFVKKGL